VRSELQKQLRQNRLLALILLVLVIVPLLALSIQKGAFKNLSGPRSLSESKLAGMLATPAPVPTPTPTPTPKPLTFSQMNELYGPCEHMPALMYHHVQSEEAARASKQTSLTVYTDYFESQMQYLKDKGYSVVSMAQLVDFFDSGTKIPTKSVLITFDDGYEDFYTDAYPILQKMGFPATMFVPTGLVDNPGYLTWDQISSMKGIILFANHTWSHKNVQTTTSDMQYEILTADTQLADHSLNSPKAFSYPYGIDSASSEKYLTSLGYEVAFTTIPGSTLCTKLRLALPRIRIGNTPLSSYGF
jgi:peptidoglycan/xylan/chitin deacetylase (PgdA/CDA1 family)